MRGKVSSHENYWVVVKIRVPFWGTLNNKCLIVLGTQKGTLILTTPHKGARRLGAFSGSPKALALGI